MVKLKNPRYKLEDVPKAKIDIKKRYLEGESMAGIARSYDISLRVAYYHLGKLTPDEIAEHAGQKVRRDRKEKSLWQKLLRK